MGLRWTPRLAIGIAAVDDQHRELLDRLVRLTEAMQARDNGAELDRLMAFLGDYVITHFRNEERLMEERGYPEFAAHRLQHEALVADHARLSAELARLGPTAGLAQAISQRLGHWLIQHIMSADRELGVFLMAQPRVA